MPRSGSTLVEQILSSHPDVYGAGEVKYLSRALGQLRDRFPSLPKYPEMMAKITPAQLDIVAKNYQQALAQGAGDAKKITDKLLTNYFFLGLINLLFPKAKVIHTQRDPVDTCLRGFTKLFKDDMPHSYDLGELGRYYGKYRELMEHWEKVLPEGFMTTVVYEDVVADTEKEARRLIEFLGLPWDREVRRLPQVGPPGEDGQRRPGPQADLQDVGQALEEIWRRAAAAGRCDRWQARTRAARRPRPRPKAKVKENA